MAFDIVVADTLPFPADDKQHVFFSVKLFQNLTAFPFKCDIDS